MTATWVDTNVLLRHLSGEPAALAARADRLVAAAREGGPQLRVATEIVCELVFVLGSRAFGYSRAEIGDVLTGLLSQPGIAPDEPELCLYALQRMAALNVPFVDALLAGRAERKDETVATLDVRDFTRLGARLHAI
ncbi:MAG TPA: PIN domain-containing protein [Candidatus Limnocylindria bacterium]|jgi:predicted nucleic-acid-binding protein